jgi:hypothetical protein
MKGKIEVSVAVETVPSASPPLQRDTTIIGFGDEDGYE